MTDDPFAEPADTREQILAATYRTLCDRGYADLTISAIGEEFEKSPSLVYRHYDSKDDLVLECLQHMLDRFDRQLTDADLTDPQERLAEVVALDEDDGPPERQQFFSALVELRSRAVHDEAYREHFTRSDEQFVSHISEIVRAGIDQGVFRECDPEQVAQTLVTTLSGAMVRHATSADDDWLGDFWAGLEAYLERCVYRNEAVTDS